jgi:lipopolysaccharide/colanic/teichoic acid biosynthesis glycosyltransferase
MIVGEDVQQSNCKKPLLDREEVLRSSKKYWFVRRAQDLLLSSVALLLLWPIMLVVALLIVIDDPKAGPIFTQTRIGRDGKPFKFYKFRSMCANAEEKLQELLDQNEMEGPVFKIKEDPRITRVGKFIRKTSLDELPQLWNVFIGDMSIVGPRPGLPREVEQYDDYARQRLLVQPGLTCFWQVQKNRNQLSFEEWLELDIKYIRQRSFLTDWKIMFATIATVFRMDGV